MQTGETGTCNGVLCTASFWHSLCTSTCTSCAFNLFLVNAVAEFFFSITKREELSHN